jgi:activator of HSP90 ATPase
MSRTIRQTVTLAAAPRRVYGALLDEHRHSAFTGEAAVISRRVGGAFTCYGGYITGYHLELVPQRRIVQAWRSRNWPAGAYSVVTFELSRLKGGRTRLAFTQVGVPAFDRRAKSGGWRSRYWKPLRAYLED